MSDVYLVKNNHIFWEDVILSGDSNSKCWQKHHWCFKRFLTDYFHLGFLCIFNLMQFFQTEFLSIYLQIKPKNIETVLKLSAMKDCRGNS